MHDLLHASLPVRDLERDREIGRTREAHLPALRCRDQTIGDGEVGLAGPDWPSSTTLSARSTNPTGQIIQCAKFQRETLHTFFERAVPPIVGIEACPGAQWLARQLLVIGHTVRIIPAQCVKPYVALAAKLVRNAWVILTQAGALYERRDPATAYRVGQIARFEDR